MPRKDRTGPEGEGPGTGRGKGPCKPSKDKSQSKPDMYRIQDRPRRQRRGWNR